MREYLGGVLKVVSGVGAAEEGGSPSSFRWAAVSGISERSSLGRSNGKHAIPIFRNGISWRINQPQLKYD